MAGGQDIEDLSGSATSDDECVEAISADGVIADSWMSDCASEGRSGSYARYYTFILVDESEVTVTLESDEDTYLFIREGSGRDGSVLHEHDDIEGGGVDTDSRLSVTLRPGEYTIEATTYAAAVTGDFTLTLQGLTGQVAPPPGPTPESPADECLQAVTEDGTFSDSWSSECTSEGRSGSYARYYTFTLVDESEVTVTLESDEDTYLFIREGSGRDGSVLHEHDDIESGGADTDSRLSVTLQPGEYTIEATTYAAAVTGDFMLTLQGLTGQVARPPEPTPGTPADECLQAVTEDGTFSDSWSSECTSEGRSGSYARYYTFTLVDESEVTVTLESDEDTYLFIREGSGRDGSVLHEHDDIESGGADTDSRLSVTLQPGEYTIEATTYAAAVTGDFMLTLQGLTGQVARPPEPTPGTPADECLQAVTEDGTFSDSWSSECTSEGRSGSYARYYTFTLEEVREIAISLESTQDPYLFLREGTGRDGTVLHENDDIEGSANTNSRVNETLAVGDYTIEATTYEAETSGDFTISISGLPDTVEPPASPSPEPMPEPISEGCGEALTGDGATAGTWGSECESEGRSGSYARYYTFALATNAEVTIRLDSTRDTYLFVREGAGRDGSVLHENDDVERSANTNSLIRETLATGTYTIEATTYDAGVTGDFTLTISGLTDDRAALVALYNATGGPNWTNSDNWLSDAPIREWFGVGVDSHERVIYLYLGGLELTGELPPELGDLGALEDLRLGTNRLSGEMPSEIGNLNNLTRIHLDTNQFRGEVPTELGNLSNLRELLLYSNELSGEIPEELGNLTSLQKLNLADNQLSGEMSSELGDLTSLNELNLAANQLSGKIPASLGNLINLESLELGWNRLSGEIPAELGDLTSLTSLQLQNNSLSGEIPAELGDLSNLTTLHLYDNLLTGEIPSELCGLASLTSLQLQENSLSGEIPSELGNLSSLQLLYLFSNDLSGEIPAELGNLSDTRSIILSHNELSGEIPAELGNLTGILQLSLEYNRLSGEIPAELGNLTSLQYLRLRANELIGEIPAELGNLTNLRTLYLTFNRLTGEIPPELGDLSSLTFMSLSTNRLTGAIPRELGNLSNLTELWIRDNRLTGEIPSELGSLTKLSELLLFGNQISGEIPPELGKLLNLQLMGLFENKLSGEVPPELGNLSSLVTLYLQDNQLDGEIPPELGNLSNLRVLDLSENQLSGAIPEELSGMSSLGDLYLSGNQLGGEIPPELGSLSNLEVLGLNRNDLLGGPIPSEVLDIPDLKIMYIFGTGLTPDVPDYPAEKAVLTSLYNATAGSGWTDNERWLSDDPAFKWAGVGIDRTGHVTAIALAENGLSGEIPSELGDLSYLVSLVLNDNHLTEEIPPELGNLERLERLYLSGNSLTGCIPLSLVRLDLKRHDLSQLDLEDCEDEMSEGQSRILELDVGELQVEQAEVVRDIMPHVGDK